MKTFYTVLTPLDNCYKWAIYSIPPGNRTDKDRLAVGLAATRDAAQLKADRARLALNNICG